MNRREVLQRTAMVLGYAITGPALIGVLNGCKAAPGLPFKPVFLTMDQALLVAEIAEIIIPKTETPGAKDVGVPMFIDSLLNEVYDKEGQRSFVKSLTEFNDDATKTYGHDFVKCSDDEKVELFRKHHDAAIKSSTDKRSAGFWNAAVKDNKPFILQVKELTLTGFFTSEAGATQVLQYNPVPGPFKGCVPLSEVGKSWAT